MRPACSGSGTTSSTRLSRGRRTAVPGIAVNGGARSDPHDGVSRCQPDRYHLRVAKLVATLGEPADDAAVAVRRAAGSLGWAWDEGQSSIGMLVFTRGVNMLSWGAEYRVQLEPIDTDATRLTVWTSEKFAVGEWGRGQRAAHRLFKAVGAEVSQE